MFNKKSISKRNWELNQIEERLILSFSQKLQIPILLSKLLLIRNIKEDNYENFINPNFFTYLIDPNSLKDMEKASLRVMNAIKNNERIGIIADYDVDGSTSLSILHKFLKNFTNKIFFNIPNRLIEGYGPNFRIMDDMLEKKVDLLFTVDCGTNSFNIIDNKKYKNLDVIVIDHHLSEANLPDVFAIINPNRIDEKNNLSNLAAVGVTFLFLLSLRKTLRENNYFKNKKEPNLMNYLDLVSLGTICDVVKLVDYNRLFVKKGLELINKRKNNAITNLIDKSKINSSPTSLDVGYFIGPQLNAASRIDDSKLPAKLLTSDDINEIDNISTKLNLLNEKRKIIENKIFNESIKQAELQKKNKFILVYGENWHNGVLGIIASKLISYFYKPCLVISFEKNLGVGSARSIENLDLGRVILNAKNLKIIDEGGGHSMAAGFKLNIANINKFKNFLNNEFNKFDDSLFKKIDKFDGILSVNEINNELITIIDQLQPYGNGNPEPQFIIKDLIIDTIKIIKEKHIMIFYKNLLGENLKAICFNCIGTELGEYLINFKKYSFYFSCNIKKDDFNYSKKPQLIIKDAMIIN